MLTFLTQLFASFYHSLFLSAVLFSLPHSFPPPCMTRDRPARHCLRQQIQRPRCPSCGKRFTDVLRHLNHKQSKCADWFNTPPHQHQLPLDFHQDLPKNPTDSAIRECSPEPLPPPLLPRCIGFPGAAKTYGRAKSFMDKFNDDRYSGFRTTNIYYPFMSKNEWELASFLLSSGLSMRKIDDFLRLKMVSLTTLSHP